MEVYVPTQLLTKNNHKTIKGEKEGWYTYILYMSPAKQNALGVNNCPSASAGCIAACLYKSGKGGMSNVQKGRINKTHLLNTQKELFLNKLDAEITKLKKKHAKKGEKMCVRLNGTSDRMFEFKKEGSKLDMCVRDGKTIFELHPDVQFYDYTKIAHRFFSDLPKNYHLTFSRSEEKKNHEQAKKVLAAGGNVSVVFDKLPKTYWGYPVINGDETDLRFLDTKNVIVGLKFKRITGAGGKEANVDALKSGFVVRHDDVVESVSTAPEMSLRVA
jgi:hypothetical protein